jgi:hypothetical protein
MILLFTGGIFRYPEEDRCGSDIKIARTNKDGTEAGVTSF